MFGSLTRSNRRSWLRFFSGIRRSLQNKIFILLNPRPSKTTFGINTQIKQKKINDNIRMPNRTYLIRVEGGRQSRISSWGLARAEGRGSRYFPIRIWRCLKNVFFFLNIN